MWTAQPCLGSKSDETEEIGFADAHREQIEWNVAPGQKPGRKCGMTSCNLETRTLK